MVDLQVFPEPQPEGTGELVEAAVVDAGLTLAQVVDDQVADGLAGEVVAGDHLLGGERPGELGADHPDGGRGAGREGPGGVQELVEERAVPVVGVGLAGERGQGAVEQLDAVAGGDVGEQAAFGRHDQADPLDGRVERGVPGAGGFPQCLQGGDAGGVADTAHLGGDAGGGGGGQQPGQPGADDVAADQLGQPGAEPAAQLPCPGAVVAGGLQAGEHLVAPVRGPVRLGAAGVPSLLPRRPGVQLEPVEDLQHGQFPPVPDAGPSGTNGGASIRRITVNRSAVVAAQDAGTGRGGNLSSTARASALSRRGGACVAAVTGAVTSGPSRTARPCFPAGSPAPAREERAGASPAAGGEPAWPR